MSDGGTAETATSPEGEPASGERTGAPAPPTLADIIAARDRIRPYVGRTPIFTCSTLSRMTNTSLVLKAENLQKTGSFKVRGAINAVLQLSPAQKARGIITLSAGNHGQGLAYAASLVGVRCVVFMAEDAVPTKVEAIRGYGAEVRFAPTMDELPAAMEAYQREHSLYLVHPFADPAIIAGQGTVGLELLEDAPDIEAVVVPVGGGGLISGIAIAIKSQRPEVKVIGVEPEGAPTVSQSLAAGKPLVLGHGNTIADGLAAPYAASLTQEIIKRYVDDVVLVSDDEIAEALVLILERAKLLVEPAGAAGVAALLTGKAGVAQGTRAAAILSGGNIDPARLKHVL